MTRETEILSNILNNFLQEVAVAEIVIKGCSRVLGLLTTKKPDSQCYNGSCQLILTKSARFVGRIEMQGGSDYGPRAVSAGRMLDIHVEHRPEQSGRGCLPMWTH